MFAVFATLLCSVLVASGGGHVDAISDSSIVASYEDGVVEIGGESSATFAGGYVSFEIIAPGGSTVSRTYSPISSECSFGCRVATGILSEGRYAIIASFTAIGLQSEKHVADFIVGSSDAKISAVYSEGTVTISGIAPAGYESGYLTCRIASSDSLISSGYSAISSDGSFKLAICTGTLQLGDYTASVSFDVAGKKTSEAVCLFSVEYTSSDFGDYTLAVKSFTESGGIVYVSCRAEGPEGSFDYVLRCKLDGDGISITSVDCNGDAVLLIPSSVTVGKEYKVTSIAEGAFTSIEKGRFIGNSSIIGAIFSSDFEADIPNNAFLNDSRLSFVRLSDHIRVIGANAFSGTALTEVRLPDKLEKVDWSAFVCSSLSKVYSDSDANGLKYIGSGAISSSALKYVYLPFRDVEVLPYNWINQSSADIDIQSTNGSGRFEASPSGYDGWVFELEGSERISVVYVPPDLSGEVVIPEGIKKLDARFRNVTNSFTVSLPSTLEDISGGFSSSKVTGVVFAEGFKIAELGSIFSRCNSLEKITIPESVTKLRNTFQNCTSLNEVVFECSNIRLEVAFSGCTKLTSDSLIFKNGCRIELGSAAFMNCSFTEFRIPEGTVSVNDQAFYGCKDLVKVTIPSTLESMGLNAFASCTSLESFDIVGTSGFVFKNGVLLCNGELLIVPAKAEAVTVPGTVTSIPSDIFKDHSKLASVYFENGEASLKIPDNCFYKCPNLMEVHLSSNVISIGAEAFGNIKKDLSCEKLSTVTIADGSRLEKIGDRAFKYTGLLEFRLPDAVREIGDEAFSNCSVLGMFTVSNSSNLESLGEFALSTTSVRAMYLPKSLSSIGGQCFHGCGALTTIVSDSKDYTMRNGALCHGSELIFVPSSLSTLVIPSDIDSFEKLFLNNPPRWYSAFGTAASLESITVEAGNKAFASVNGILMDSTGTKIVYVPAAIGDLVIPSGVVKTETIGTGDQRMNPFRDVTSLRSLVWESQSGISSAVQFVSLNEVERVVLKAPSVEIKSLFNNTCHVGTFAISSDDLKPGYMSNPIDMLVLECENVDFGSNTNNRLMAEALCTSSKDVQFDRIVIDGAPVYIQFPDPSFTPSRGVYAGTYVLDHDDWTVKTSSMMVDGKPVYLEDELDLVVKSIVLEDGRLRIVLDLNGYSATSWNIDVLVNGVLAENGGDGAYTRAIDASASAFDVEIRAHESSETFTVDFDTAGGSDVGSLTVMGGGTIEDRMPGAPRRAGYSFDGWFTDSGCVDAFVPTSRITEDITLYAKWKSNGDNALLELESESGRIIATIHEAGKSISSGTLVPKGTVIDLECELGNGWELLFWEVNGVMIEGSGNSFAITEDSVVSPVLRYTSQSNSLTNIIDVKTPEYGQDVRLLWSRHYAVDTSMGVWSGFPSVPAVMDDAVYIRASDTLYKYDASTGEELVKVQSRTIVAYYLYLGIGGGMVVDYATDRVYDEDLNYRYDTPKKFVAVFYNDDDGMFYGLSGGKVFRFDAATGTLDTRGAWGEGVEVTWFGLYGTTSAPVFVGDHMYIVSARTSSEYRGLTEINLSTGKATTMEIKGESGRLLDDGWLTHYAYKGKDYLFLTTYSKGLLDTEDAARPASIIGIEVGSDGTLSDQCKTLRLDTSSQALSAFVVYNGRGYASGHVMDANKICDAISDGITYIDETKGNAGYQIYKEDAVSSHGSIVLTTAYATEENGYTVYIYMLAYDPSQQAVYIFEDNQNKKEAGKYYKTSPAGSAYGSQAIRATKDGNLVWYTDSGTVYCYGTPANNPYHFELKLDGRTENIDGVGFTALDALKSGLKGAGIPFEITSTGMIVSLDGVNGVWNIEYLYEGKWTNAGLLSAERNDVYRTFRISMEAGSSGEEHDLEVTISEDSKQLYSSGESNRTATITVDIVCDWPVTIMWSSSDSSIVRIVGAADGRSVIIEGLKAGEATISATVRSGGSYDVVTCRVMVMDPPAKLSEYRFFIKITKDFDKANCHPYTEADLRAGIEISAMAYNAAEALEKACKTNGIEIDAYFGTSGSEDLKGWINSMFGLKQYQGPEDMSLWTYWAQYKDWNYNQYTLGYYTDGGDFQIIWKTTNEDGSDVPGGGEEITIDTDKDGNTVKTVKDSTEMPDGTLVKTEIKVVTDKDGNLLSKTETKTEERPDGSKTSNVEKTENIKKDDGTEVVEKTGNETVTDKDGNLLSETETSDTEEKRPDGTVVKTNTENVVEKDSSGKVLNETREERTVETGAGGTVTTESFEKKTDGKTTESKNVVSKAADGSAETKVEATIVDGKVEKAESTTVIAPTEGKVGADAAKAAVERSADAISRAGIDEKDVEKTFEVSGASVSVEPGALGAIADHGAGLRFTASEKDSVHLDGDACRSLSGQEGAIDLSMSEGQEKDLLDAQKGAVGDRFFIVLDAVVGDKRIHDLGGKASVSFGYTPAEGENVSKLRVWYVDDEGSRHVVEGSLYDPEKGGFTMELTHFSVYMVAEDSSAPSPEPEPEPSGDDEGSGFSSIAIAAIAVVIVAAIVAVAVIRMRKA